MVLLIVFLVLSSAGVFGAALTGRQYETFLPLSVTGVAAALFVSGLVGGLTAGVYVILAAAAVLYIISAAALIRRKNLRSFCENLFTPAFCIFALAFIVTAVLDCGHVASRWDEYTHWANIVKVMTSLDDFGTGPLANSSYQTYPPGMGLFQYFYQAVGKLTGADHGFVEWWIYHAYQVFFFAFILPLVGRRGMTVKKLALTGVLFGLIALAPTVFYAEFFLSVYIDAIVGTLSGCGLYALCAMKDRKRFFSVYLCCVCFMLTLVKDAGLCFAVFLLIGFLVNNILIDKAAPGRFVFPAVAAACVALPKLLWSLEIKLSGAPETFSAKVDVGELFALFAGGGSEFHRAVLEKFCRKLFVDREILFITSGVRLSYIFTLAFFIVLMAVMILLAKRRGLGAKESAAAMVISVVQTVVYAFGTLVVFLFKFTENESLGMSSLSRYINICFLAMWLMLLLCGFRLTADFGSAKLWAAVIAVLCAVTMFSMPWGHIGLFVTRDEIGRALGERALYTPVCDSIAEYAEPGDSVFLISQENNGFDYWAVRYIADDVRLADKWSLCAPGDEGYSWMAVLTPEEWRGTLADGFDFVALYDVDEYFISTYGCVFDDPSDIAEGSIYAVAEDGRLTLCE